MQAKVMSNTFCVALVLDGALTWKQCFKVVLQGGGPLLRSRYCRSLSTFNPAARNRCKSDSGSSAPGPLQFSSPHRLQCPHWVQGAVAVRACARIPCCGNPGYLVIRRRSPPTPVRDPAWVANTAWQGVRGVAHCRNGVRINEHATNTRLLSGLTPLFRPALSCQVGSTTAAAGLSKHSVDEQLGLGINNCHGSDTSVVTRCIKLRAIEHCPMLAVPPPNSTFGMDHPLVRRVCAGLDGIVPICVLPQGCLAFAALRAAPV